MQNTYKRSSMGLAAAIGLMVHGCIGDDQFMETMTDASASASSGSSSESTTTTSVTTTVSGTTTSASASGTTTTGVTTIVETSGSTFIITPDGGAGTKECDVWTQDCPDGQKCMPYSGDGDNSWESLKCVPVMENPGKVGDPCTVKDSGVSGIDSCEEGAMCWGVDSETLMGVCVEQCKGSPDAPICETPGTSCLIGNDGVLTLCLPSCDPLLQDCPGDDLCVPNPMDPNSFICVIDASGEEGQEWDVCEYANACDAGLLCANPALAVECDAQAAGCCLPFCDTSIMPPECKGASQECLPWYEMGQAPPGFENVGICGIPQ